MKRVALTRNTPLRASLGSLRRTGMLHGHADPVTPELHAAVIARDRAEMRKANLVSYLVDTVVCIAPIVDPAERGHCWGRTTLDHVKPEPRMGKRAHSVEQELVSVCAGHSEDGRMAGHQWNTANRQAERDYLARLYPETTE